MSFRLGTGMVARLAFVPALLWLACGNVPRDGDGDPRREGLESQSLQLMEARLWSSTDALPPARDRHTATLLPSGKVLVSGGYGPVSVGGDKKALDSAQVYDPLKGKWESTGHLIEARFWHTATLLPSGKVLVTGGYGAGLLKSAEVYDPGTGSWSSTEALGMTRAGHTATLLLSGKVLVTGGYSASDGGALKHTEVYDPKTGRWSPTGQLKEGRIMHTATLLPSGKVLVTGGSGALNPAGTGFSGIPIASAEVYDPETGQWSTTTPLDTARYYHTATLLPSGEVLVTGGYGKTSNPLDSTQVYDPVTGGWNTTAFLGTARFLHAATLLPSGEVLVSGGRNPAGFFASAEVYDPKTAKWSTTVSMSEARDQHTATLLPSGKVLVTGGSGSDEHYLASAEVYDDAVTSIRPAVSPILPQKPGAIFSVQGTDFSGTVGGPGIVHLQNSAGGSPRELPATVLSNTSVQVNLTGVQEGYHLLFVLANGVAGGQLLRVDGTPPNAPVVTSPEKRTWEQLPVIAGVAEPGSFVTVWLDGIKQSEKLTADKNGNWSYKPHAALADKEYEVKASARDDVGNDGPPSDAYIFTVDTKAPDAPVVTRLKEFTNNPVLSLAGTAEPGSSITVWLDGIEQPGKITKEEAENWSFTSNTALADKEYEIKVIATDDVGNDSLPSEEHRFTVDTLPPDAPVVTSPEELNDDPVPLIAGRAESGSLVTVWLDGIEQPAKATADEAGNWSFTPNGLDSGPHLVSAFAMDRAGNTSDSSAEYSFITQRSHYGWNCTTAPALPASWALLVLALALGRRYRAR
ncbi:kelch domain protein [Cystobacter fuscus DSM 2262]|uniref:Kelch domain protein n=1 Tax=Cystobacter fuscus (strain ATCC 25194 / DSM 2262 / NBRC 100088 / M29) TaxID=1242864 RepID=S9NT09_CYSF2|nr:kelch domain protein [Cystobacter fuscus DSM 2262]